MVSIRRFVGKVPLARGLRFTTRHGHISRHAKRKNSGFMAVSPKLKEVLSRQIEIAEKTGMAKKRLPSYKRMRNIALQLEGYAGIKPSYAQAVSALSMQHGLYGESLLADANSLHSLNRRAEKIRRPLLSDKNSGILTVVKKGGLAKVASLLDESGKPLTVDAIAKKTGLSRKNATDALISLESAKISQQLPQETNGIGGQNYRWIAQEKRLSPETKPALNAGYLTMEALQSGKKSVSELVKPARILNGTIGTGTLNPQATRVALQNLEKQGIISSHAERIAGVRRKVLFFSLTERGKRLLKMQHNRKSLLPELRQTFLGMPFSGLMPRENRRLQAMIRYIAIRGEYEKAPRKIRVRRGTRISLAEKHNTNVWDVKHISMIKNAPWENISLESLRLHYLPEMYKLAPGEARWFDQFLKQNEGKMRRRTTKAKRIILPLRPVELFEKNQRLAFWLANRAWKKNHATFQRLGLEWDDIKQESLIALQRAAEHFNPKKGKFSIIAGKFITNQFKQIEKSARAKKRRGRTISLSETVEGRKSREEPRSAGIEDKRMLLGNTELRDALLMSIKGMKTSERNKLILIERFGLHGGIPKELRELGKQFGLTHQRVQQIELLLLKKLRGSSKTRELWETIK